MEKIKGLVELFCKLSAGRGFNEKTVQTLTKQISEHFVVVESSVIVSARDAEKCKADFSELSKRKAIHQLAEYLIENNVVTETHQRLDEVDRKYYKTRTKYSLTVLK